MSLWPTNVDGDASRGVAGANGISADQVIDPESVTIPDTAIEALMDHSGLSDADRMVLCEENDGYRDAIQSLLCAESLKSSAIGQ